MALKTKCILSPREESDGWRVSVMSRHTLEDGKTPDERITEELYDYHAADLAPSPELVGSYLRGEINWGTYEERYDAELEKKWEKVFRVAMMALDQDVTLLCIDELPEHCHRRVLARKCKQYIPYLQIEIN